MPPSDEANAGDPDRELVARSRLGDRRAFDELVKRHSAGIVGIVRRYVKSPADAEDVAQAAFTQAFQRLDGFREEAAFRTWLYRIAVNLALNHVRAAVRLEPLDLGNDERFTNALGTDKLVAAEIWRTVKAKLCELPPKQRLVVELRLFHEHAFREVAAIAGCSEEAAKANFRHAMKKLRALLPAPGT